MNKILFLLLIFCIVSSYGTDDIGRKIFEQKCSACHTIGKGKLVGPDLKGVSERRDLEWLKRFIKSPTSLINAKDNVALSLLKEYGTPMPDLGLTDDEVNALVNYLKSPEESRTTNRTFTYYISLALGTGLAIMLSFLAFLFSKKSVEVKV
ncbi:cytochrome c [Hydrogenobacter thermophilus]|uniref:c-type cytochrome n=1 Tax=Hydrogenobacter thermophilus TaxID=940 RepID=UPI0030F7FE4D